MPARDDDYDDEDDAPRGRRGRARDGDRRGWDDRDEDDRPRRRSRAPQTNGLALAGLIVGLVSIPLACLSPVALLLSSIGLARAGSRGGAGRGQAIGGLAAGVLGLVVGVTLVFALVLPAVQKVRDAARRVDQMSNSLAVQTNNFKQVGLAAHNYESVKQTFPPAVAPDRNAPAGADPNPADPSTRLGFRAAILPYIEQEGLYRSLDFGQAWDSPKNAPTSNTPISTYSDPADGLTPTNQTRIRGFTGNGALFDPDPKRMPRIVAITDGTANTILYAESAQLVPWAQNNEMPFSPTGPLPALGHPSRSVFLVVLADGSVRTVRNGVSPAALRAAITYKGNDFIPLD